MKLVCQRLAKLGIDLSTMDALEFFAREGDWQTTVYAGKVKSLEAWEINARFADNLRMNLPMARVVIGDSFRMAKSATPDFGLVVFDNPMGLYEDHCEHFDALLLLRNLLRTPGIVIFNVNHNPFSIEEQLEWAKRRKEFYGRDKVDIPFLIDFYRGFFERMGYIMNFCFEQKRTGYMSYFVFGLDENSNTST